ncbi:MAG: hypothetical protein KAS32_05035 [Candidatus Peribacteraceae bacterium]|nr:hypothetical protein [Candidatus Peribacteraceae bacterium]
MSDRKYCPLMSATVAPLIAKEHDSFERDRLNGATYCVKDTCQLWWLCSGDIIKATGSCLQVDTGHHPS